MHFHFTGNCGRVTVDARGARRILKRRNVGRLMAAIREVNHSEELTFGRSSSRTTLRPRGFLLIDRQVTDRHMPRRLDLLGLRQLGERARAGSWSSRSRRSSHRGFLVVETEGRRRRNRSVAHHRSAGASPVRAGQRRPRRRFVSLAALSPRSYAGRHDVGTPFAPVPAIGSASRRGPQRQR